MEELLAQLMQYVDEIAGLVVETAPAVWEILIRQVYVEVVGNALWALVGLVLVVVASLFIRPVKKAVANQGRYDENECWYIAIVLAYLAGVPLFLASLYAVLARLINPAWYAVKILLEASGIN